MIFPGLQKPRFAVGKLVLFTLGYEKSDYSGGIVCSVRKVTTR